MKLEIEMKIQGSVVRENQPLLHNTGGCIVYQVMLENSNSLQTFIQWKIIFVFHLFGTGRVILQLPILIFSRFCLVIIVQNRWVGTILMSDLINATGLNSVQTIIAVVRFFIGRQKSSRGTMRQCLQEKISLFGQQPATSSVP